MKTALSLLMFHMALATIWADANIIVVEPQAVVESYGDCRITFYCPCSRCCGKTDGITASGVLATPNHTVAATLPFGTRLLIDGEEYVVEDRGVGDHQIDIFVSSHDEALRRGLYYTEVFIIKE